MAAEDSGPTGRRSWVQRVLLLVSTGLTAVFLVSAVGLGYVYTKFGRLPRIEIANALTSSSASGDARDPGADDIATGARNFLIVGVDSADGLDPDDPLAQSRTQIGGLRSDTTMILRVDPASSRGALLSIPRDLAVPISGTRGTQKINAAIQIGGPEMLINTIQDNFGIPIHHYVQIDFAGFFDLVDALEGVPIHFPHPVRDRRSGLYIETPGCHVLDGRAALSFVRSRAYSELIDGRWRVDGTGDLGRIHRQQLFIQVALQRAVSEGIRNPAKLDELIDAALDAVVADDTLDGNDIFALAGSFRAFRSENLDLYSLPVGGGFRGGAEVLLLRERPAEEILAVFRGISPDALTESSVRVAILNGSGVSGQAGEARSDLLAAGFAIEGTGDAESFEIARTVVRHPEGQEAAADLVARWVSGSPRIVESDDVDVVTLVTGLDYRGVRDEPQAPTSSTSTTSTTLPSTSTSSSTTRPGATTTTILGTIPTNSEAVAECG